LLHYEKPKISWERIFADIILSYQLLYTEFISKWPWKDKIIKKGVVNLNQKIFVYGTLREGQSNFGLISDLVKSITPATTRGWMFDLGGYPVLVDGSGHISGEVMEFHDPEEAIKRMDALEGYNGPNNASNHYEREQTTVEMMDGRLEICEVYRYSENRKQELISRYPIIFIGDWNERRKVKWYPYYAYGSCMNPVSFEKDVPTFKVVGKADVIGYRVAFTRKSIKWGAGVADLITDLDCVTEGVLYLIPEGILDALDTREGAGKHLKNPAYRRLEIEVNIDGISLKALTYEVVRKEVNEIAPSREYMNTIMEGTTLLSPAYVQMLEEHMESLIQKEEI
jgi:gamma-glutamylcyclotransferase (GGCT)/AIG2-like uncharacterized protein YtfP